jgi:hypothetical protein
MPSKDHEAAMTISEATTSYESWMRRCTTVVEAQLRRKHRRMRWNENGKRFEIAAIEDGMATLDQRIKNALDEARMVVLVVQVLMGFQFRAVLEHGFDRLPRSAQYIHLGALALLLGTFALAVSPATFHRLAEHGQDTGRVLDFTSRMVGLALLPFAAAFGSSFFVVGELTGNPIEAVIMGLAAFFVAVGLWYAWPMFHRRARVPAEREIGRGGPLSAKIDHVLTEARMVLPGAQALLGFQFLSFFAEGFEHLPPASRAIHLASLSAVTLASMLLIAPAAFHRIAERGQATPRFYQYASWMVQASLVPLALGLSGDFYVVVAKVSESVSWGVMASGALLVAMFALWFGYPLLSRRPHSPP